MTDVWVSTLDHARIDVARGAAVLDASNPGWHYHIDIGRLDLTSSNLCILGQLFGGDYITGLEKLQHFVKTRPCFEFVLMTTHGFAGLIPSALEQAWTEAIQERRKADADEYIRALAKTPTATRELVRA